MDYLLVLLGIIASVFLIIALLSLISVKLAFGNRCEGNKYFKYLSAEDFDNLSAHSVEFPSVYGKGRGNTLRGFLYSRGEVNSNKLIVFSHGMGGGHQAYTGLINAFCECGYTVFAYDNTGTILSDGKKIYGLYQGSCDLMSAVEFIKGDDCLKGKDIYLLGHSAGAVAVCRVLPVLKGVKGACAISGYDSEIREYTSFASNIVGKNLAKVISFFLSIGSFLLFGKKPLIPIHKMSTDTPLLLIHGADDATVNVDNSALKNISERKNLRKKLCKGKGHNPYQTSQSERYMNEKFAGITAADKQYKGKIPENIKEDFLKSVDYSLMTEIDSSVLNEIVSFFD